MDSIRWTKIKDLFMRAFDLPEPERAAFLATCDADLRPEVESLLRADIDAGEFINEPAAVDLGLAQEQTVDPYLGQQIDSYKIVKEIGHGGMGTVYLAHHTDESFDKQVALKLIKRGMDTKAVLKRFVMERRILAQLQHRFIANLLDGGSTPDGLPYFVMEHVEGMPITKFCASHELSIDERLELFRKVCSAISYAHQNLVVHRDIKPSNILVTEDGVPKLLDFGIAKLLRPDWSHDTNEATATMFRVLTPEYASPEQMRGAPITTTSDVYSLGVVLYELLCGERPFKLEGRMPDEAAQIVLTEEPIRPSSVVSSESKAPGSQKSEVLTDENNEPPATNNEQSATPKSKTQNLKSLRGDLDNIILKTLAKEPERRYQSVQELSEDIRRHLVGLPVTATADSFAYRTAKFLIRHRTGVIASGAVLLILLAATAITSWQAIVAGRERDKADERFNQVRKLTHTILFEYHDEIIKLPGSTPLLEKMVNNTLEYLDNLAPESNGDKDLQSEIATAYQKVGDVQGNPYRGNLGNIEGAIASYRKSLSIREKLVAENSSDAEMRRNLAKSYESIGDMLWTKGEYQEAYSTYSQNLQIHSVLESSEESTVEDSYGIARARHRMGQALSRSGDLSGALENFRLGLEKYPQIIARAPDVKKYQLGKGSVLLKIGDMLAAQEDWQGALENHREALGIWSTVASLEPLDAALKRNTVIASDRIATDLRELSNFGEALKSSTRAVKIQEEIADADPKNVQFVSELGLYYVNLGGIQGKLKNFPAARENVMKGLKTLQEFADASPQWIDLRRDLALAYRLGGEVFTDEGDFIAAAADYQRSADILETAPLRTELTEKLAQNYGSIGDIYQKAGRVQEAKKWFQKGVALLTELEQQGKLKHPDYVDDLTKKIIKCDVPSSKAHG